MNDLKLKERIFKNPITTLLSIVIAVGAVVVNGADFRTNLFAVAFAIAGSLMKDPQLPGGGSPA